MIKQIKEIIQENQAVDEKRRDEAIRFLEHFHSSHILLLKSFNRMAQKTLRDLRTFMPDTPDSWKDGLVSEIRFHYGWMIKSLERNVSTSFGQSIEK
jgi:hypothetical protein